MGGDSNQSRGKIQYLRNKTQCWDRSETAKARPGSDLERKYSERDWLRSVNLARNTRRPVRISLVEVEFSVPYVSGTVSSASARARLRSRVERKYRRQGEHSPSSIKDRRRNLEIIYIGANGLFSKYWSLTGLNIIAYNGQLTCSITSDYKNQTESGVLGRVVSGKLKILCSLKRSRKYHFAMENIPLS